MTWLRTLLLVLAIANVVLAIVGELAFSAMTGLSYTVVTSTYREFDCNGVVNHEKLGETWGPEYVDDWHKVVDCLVGEPLDGLYGLSHAYAVALLLNGVLLFAAWWQIRKTKVPAERA